MDNKKSSTDWRFILTLAGGIALLVVLIIALIMIITGDGKDAADEPNVTVVETETEVTEDNAAAEDPQEYTEGSMSAEEGSEVDVAEILTASGAAETDEITFGIDVSKYQGTIDWAQVAEAGIDFAMVRVGYRTQSSGEICEDSNAKYNIQEATANGIKVGAYFFSTAVTKEEALEEADWVADYIAQYQITYPVAYNCEGFSLESSRQYGLTSSERTNIATAFLDRIYERGYTPMFYASKNEMAGSAEWDMDILSSSYRLWVAWYPDYVSLDDDSTGSVYADGYSMWQYTSRGAVSGISVAVDLNVAYFGYDGVTDAQSDEAPEEVEADVEALMNFTEVNETVTAKDATNLRDIPSQGSDSTVVFVLANGDTAVRTGVSDSGWSRVEYGGQTLYAVSSYLTTDLSYKPAEDDDDGIKTQFTSVNDTVTAKIEVNLRTLPSVTNENSVVVTTLKNGETVTRTGINEDYGWSRVEYNGQTLYCVSSYLTVVE